jgi:hypothetical protein
MLRLLIFAFIAFWLFSKVINPQANDDRSAAPGSQPRQQNLPRYDIEPQTRGRQLEEVDAAPQLPETGPRRSAETRSDAGDWSIEEVETKTGPRRSDSETRFDPRGNANRDAEAKKTTKGDWSIEEVETNE